jgi:formylglycine-generating enzyme required for sulfatase activity
MKANTLTVAVAAVLLAAGAARANVFNMGPGLTSLETVPVGNPGNAGELSGEGAGGYGPDRICGAVPYEYRIGKYEVTAGQYTEFLNAVAKIDTYGVYNTSMAGPTGSLGCNILRNGSYGSYTYSVPSDWANRPVNYMTFWDCCRFANWLHNGQPTGAQGAGTTERGAYTLDGYNGYDGRTIQRNAGATWAIPSEDEWYKAAYHKNDGNTGSYFNYPTSSNNAPGQNMADVSGNNANYYTSPYVFPIDSGKYTTLVGEFQNSDSPYSTFDMGGNVWEWNEAIISNTYGFYRGLRGGSFSGWSFASLLASGRSYDHPAWEYFDYGFRVVQVPEPATLSLLALGACLPLCRRRSRQGLAVFRRRGKRNSEGV